MGSVTRRRFPPGRQPYDPLNGIRVGALAGAILGAIVTLLVDFGPWPLVGGALGGGIVGFRFERRSSKR